MFASRKSEKLVDIAAEPRLILWKVHLAGLKPRKLSKQACLLVVSWFPQQGLQMRSAAQLLMQTAPKLGVFDQRRVWLPSRVALDDLAAQIRRLEAAAQHSQQIVIFAERALKHADRIAAGFLERRGCVPGGNQDLQL